MANVRLGELNLSWISSGEGYMHAGRHQLWEKVEKAVSDSIASEVGEENAEAAMHTAKALGSLP